MHLKYTKLFLHLNKVRNGIQASVKKRSERVYA